MRCAAWLHLGAEAILLKRLRFQLSAERLEPRRVLSCSTFPSIGGAVRIDGQTAADVELRLYMDDGDGAFDEGNDVLAATVLTTADGQYCFSDGLPSGEDYFVFQPAQTVAAGTVPQQVQFVEDPARPIRIVDAFLTPQTLAATAAEPTARTTTPAGQPSEILGGIRDLQLDLDPTHTGASATVHVNQDGAGLTLAAIADAGAGQTIGQLVITWDGGEAEALESLLNGTDLTHQGDQLGLVAMATVASELVSDVRLLQADVAEPSLATMRLAPDTGGDVPVRVTTTVAWSEFAGPVSAESVDAVQWVVPVVTGHEVRLDAIGLNGSRQLDFENLAQAPDLIGFARALSDAGVVFYGADWSGPTTFQREMFSDGAADLPFVEVTTADRTLNDVGLDNEVVAFPLWEFPSGIRRLGVQSLDTIAELSGVPVPNASDPYLSPLDDLVIRQRSPRHIPLDGYDPNGGALTFEIEVEHPEMLEASVVTGNRTLEVQVDDFGPLLIHLYEQRAPALTQRVIQLAQDGHLDGQPLTEIFPGNEIRWPDLTATLPDLPVLDDEFHLELQHNQSGVVSMRSASDDDNHSQFVVLGSEQRERDFDASVIGQLIEGDRVRAALERGTTSADGTPMVPVTVASASIIDDTENGLLKLVPVQGVQGETRVTITVRDLQGASSVQSFDVIVEPDVVNSPPFLTAPSDLETPVNVPLSFELAAVDREGDPVWYYLVSQSGVAATVDEQTGAVTVEPDDGFEGLASVVFAASAVPLVVDPENPDATVFDPDVVDLQRWDIGILPPVVNPPRISDINLVQGEVRFQLDVNVHVNFSAPLLVGELSPADLVLTGDRTGDHPPLRFSYDQITHQLTVEFGDLPVDDFELRLLSGETGIVGENGLALDGERQPEGPTGDGVPGGDFQLRFSTDRADLDGNQTLNIDDVDVLCSVLRSQLQNPVYDFNRDTEVDIEDMTDFLARGFRVPFGDANLDGRFDSSDLVAIFVIGEYEDGVAGNSTWREGDWNCDGDFSTADLVDAFVRGTYRE